MKAAVLYQMGLLSHPALVRAQQKSGHMGIAESADLFIFLYRIQQNWSSGNLMKPRVLRPYETWSDTPAMWWRSSGGRNITKISFLSVFYYDIYLDPWSPTCGSQGNAELQHPASCHSIQEIVVSIPMYKTKNEGARSFSYLSGQSDEVLTCP